MVLHARRKISLRLRRAEALIRLNTPSTNGQYYHAGEKTRQKRPVSEWFAFRTGGRNRTRPGDSRYVFSVVGTSRCDVRAACSGATPSNVSVSRILVPPATTRAGTARRAIPTRRAKHVPLSSTAHLFSSKRAAPCRPRNTQAPTAPKRSGALGTTSLPAPNLNRRSIEQIGEGTMLAFEFHDQAVVVSNTADRMDDEINGQPDQP